MKNIKEKSLELFPEMQTDSSDWDVIEEQCDRDDQRKAFVLGANYVLDEICEIVDNNSSCEKVVLEIGKLIIQLKK